jgi:hypothetical protein
MHYAILYDNLILNSSGLISPADTGEIVTLSGWMKGHSAPMNKVLGGFFDYNSVLNYTPRVALTNIQGFNPEKDGSGEWQRIPPDHYVLAFYQHDRFYIAIRDKQPMTWARKKH